MLSIIICLYLVPICIAYFISGLLLKNVICKNRGTYFEKQVVLICINNSAINGLRDFLKISSSQKAIIGVIQHYPGGTLSDPEIVLFI